MQSSDHWKSDKSGQLFLIATPNTFDLSRMFVVQAEVAYPVGIAE
jgi:hypothetical protein